MMTVSTLLAQPNTAEPHQRRQYFSILLADDDPNFRRGLRSLLEFYNSHSPVQCVIVGEAVTGAQALHLAENQSPSLVILNVDLESNWETTIDVLAQLKQLNKPPNALLISEHQQPEYLFEGMQAGASGYITKDHIATELLAAINTIEAGQIYLGPDMVNTFFYLFQTNARQSQEKCKLLKLSRREREVLKLLAQGDSNEDIASELVISVATVKSHFTSIFEKLGVKSRTQAIIRALRLGLV